MQLLMSTSDQDSKGQKSITSNVHFSSHDGVEMVYAIVIRENSVMMEILSIMMDVTISVSQK